MCFPVNLRHKTLFDLPCAFSRIQDIDDTVLDMAVIATPDPDGARTWWPIAGKKGVAGAVILSSGGRETGSPGAGHWKPAILAAAQKA